MLQKLLPLLDWIYKKKCYFCRKSDEAVKMCSKCYNEMDFLPVQINRIVEGKKVYCAGVYSKNLQKLIRGLKYHNQKELAYFQAKFMAEYFKSLKLNKNFTVVPVPLYKQRKKKRGYNHMELVGKEFCKLTGFEMNTELIERIKNTKPQYKLKKFERLENLKNAFKINAAKMDKNLEILIIDDIFTTGSTFESMIEEFYKNGYKKITCLATASAN